MLKLEVQKRKKLAMRAKMRKAASAVFMTVATGRAPSI
jgi:hypothetical protein